MQGGHSTNDVAMGRGTCPQSLSSWITGIIEIGEENMDGAQLGGGEFQPKRTEIVATMQARFLGSKYTKMISRPGLLWEAYNTFPPPNSGAIRGEG